MADYLVDESEAPIRDYIGTLPGNGPMIYTNSIEVVSSFFDVQIKLNHVLSTEIEGDGRRHLKTVHQANVAMSPQHAKSLLDLLGKQLVEYEARFGEIVMPSGDEED